jgi:chromosome segregation ATPase
LRTVIDSNATNAIQTKEDMERQKSKIIYLEQQAQNYLSQLLELKTNNSELQSDNTYLKSQVMEFQTNNSELQSDNVTMKEEISRMKEEMNKLKSDLEEFKDMLLS